MREMCIRDRKYGGRLAFHGCISTAKLAVMTPEAVAQNVAETLETMMPHYGYCLEMCIRDSSSAHFISEIGYHGCPAVSSMRQFIPEKDLWPCLLYTSFGTRRRTV